jgi:hypothetical protein
MQKTGDRSSRKKPHNNFNSPKSLKKQMSQLTSDRKGVTLESGRGTHRKLIMQDDAEVSESSLQYGSGKGTMKQMNDSAGLSSREEITANKQHQTRQNLTREKLAKILDQVNSQANFDG